MTTSFFLLLYPIIPVESHILPLPLLFLSLSLTQLYRHLHYFHSYLFRAFAFLISFPWNIHLSDIHLTFFLASFRLKYPFLMKLLLISNMKLKLHPSLMLPIKLPHFIFIYSTFHHEI